MLPTLLFLGAPPVTAGVVLTIGGDLYRMLEGWDILTAQNSRATFTFRVHSVDGTSRPGLDEEVVLSEDGVTIFGGTITETSEAGTGGLGRPPITTTVTASDFNGLALRRYVTEELPAGTLKDALEVIVDYLPGVSLDPLQVDGPALSALEWTDVRTEDVLNELSTLTGYIWQITFNKQLRMYQPGTIAAPFNITLASRKVIGDLVVEPTRENYGNRVIVRTATDRAQADDLVEQASHGIWEIVVTAPNDTPTDSVQALADAYLARSTPILKRVRYTTGEPLLEPGQTQTIDIAYRNVNNTFLIDEIRLRDGGGNRILRDVTATEGLVFQTGWRETYKRWNAAGATVAGAGAFGGTSFDRFAYFLGGSGVEAVQSPVPTWVPVSGGPTSGKGSVQVQINTVPRGTTSAQIVARLRAFSPGVSVQARLFDVTDNVACPGLSTVVTSNEWETVAFGVTLTPGSHLYELQLLPGAPDAPVFGVGYLE